MQLLCSSHLIVSLKVEKKIKNQFYVFFSSVEYSADNSTYLSDNYTDVVQFLFVNHQEEKIDLLLSFVRLFF